MNTRLIVIVAVVAVVAVGAGAAAYYMLQDEDPITGTYSFSSYIQEDITGQYLDENGEVVLELDSWDGELADLITIDGIEEGPHGEVRIIVYSFEFHTVPGETIHASDIQFGVSEDVDDRDSYGWVDAFITYDGQELYNAASDLTVTTDDSGSASMTITILTDEVHIFPDINGPINFEVSS